MWVVVLMGLLLLQHPHRQKRGLQHQPEHPLDQEHQLKHQQIHQLQLNHPHKH